LDHLPIKEDRIIRIWPYRNCWYVYPNEHYPVCASCQEPMPCREREAERIATQVMDDLARYETPGVYPSCREPVSSRQKAITFPVNVKIPGGPPVTFHAGRGACQYAATEYQKAFNAGQKASQS
jgi:hypothetical protein